ncbi:MAG: ABC transporter permease, partial [Leptonema sp. (in: Bacteria)]|nr:ABC transporter permease [Leptonema sp. (in: bacteria)]
LTLIGITLGSAAYVSFSGIMLGFQGYIIDQLINNDAQIRISPRDEALTEQTFQNVFFQGTEVVWVRPPTGRTDSTQLTNANGWFVKLDNDSRVVGYAPQIARQVIFVNGKTIIPGKFTGIEPKRQAYVTTIVSSIIVGSLVDLSRGGSAILIGAGLIEKLGTRMGETINIITPKGQRHPLRVAGVLTTGNRMLDDTIVYASIPTVQRITGSSGELTDIVIRVKDVSKAAEIASEWSAYTRDKVQSWDQAFESILSVFKMQDIVRNITTFTIILVVAFGIYNILNMVVNQKKKEIAILRSVGFDRKDTIRLFVIQGSLLGAIGALLGLALGGFTNHLIDGMPIGGTSKGGGPTITKMMVSWNTMIFVKAFLLAFLSSFLASFIPARMASKLSPVEIIRSSGT